MKISRANLIIELIERTRLGINQIQKLYELSIEELNFRESDDSWSILECIEHLNMYGDFYIPAIKTTISKNNESSTEVFKSGLLGNYFVKSMEPKVNLNKMKTFADKNPINSSLDKSVIDRFINQQKEFLELLNKSKNLNLVKAKTAISISKLLKLRLGDTFRFILAHNERHFEQIEKTLQNARG